ncbi:J domain-containing protein CG6693-like [Harmonia axyridis]|uniref:J domain-containing protein CG6693-like n=1 Tax=Harmonia axyridis TaxID=115357 RepID=UPI001E275A70|nr:J domain-containing protein CG6693-like [Harmonia axyridis]
MSSFKENCEKYFGTADFYEVLEVAKDASQKEIKKAYHKLSLLVHPDRVDDSQKLEATEKFKVLGKIHSILQDENKRKIYDDSGEFDDEGDGDFNWMEYWRSLFKKISLKDIQNFEEDYIGSETEVRDIRKAYESCKGNMTKMMEHIPFANPETEPRIIEVIRGLVDKGEVEEYDQFFNEPAKRRRLRHKKYQKEKEEVEKESSVKKAKFQQYSDLEKNYIGSEDEYTDIKNAYESWKGDITKMMDTIPFANVENEPRIIEIVRGMVDREEVQKYELFFNEPLSKKQKRHHKLKNEREGIERYSMEDEESLSNEIQERASSNFMNMISNLEAKYGNNKSKSLTEVKTTAKKRKFSKK